MWRVRQLCAEVVAYKVEYRQNTLSSLLNGCKLDVLCSPLVAGTLLGVMSIFQTIDSELTIHSTRDDELATCKQRVRQLMTNGRTEESIQRFNGCLDVHGGRKPN